MRTLRGCCTMFAVCSNNWCSQSISAEWRLDERDGEDIYLFQCQFESRKRIGRKQEDQLRCRALSYCSHAAEAEAPEDEGIDASMWDVCKVLNGSLELSCRITGHLDTDGYPLVGEGAEIRM